MQQVNLMFFGLAICGVASFYNWNWIDFSKDPGIGKSQSELEPEMKQEATKTDLPDGEQQLIDFKKAYEILNDAYIQGGSIGENPEFLDSNHKCVDAQLAFDPDIVFCRKLSVTSEYLEQTIVPKSKTKVYIVMFYTDFCIDCKELAAQFKSLFETFEPLGVQFATINAVLELSFLPKTGVETIPQIIIVLDGKYYVYRWEDHTPEAVGKFLRKKLPSKIGRRINDDTVNGFLNGWSDNRVRALVFESQRKVALKYLVTAFGFKDRVAFGFVNLSNKGKTKMIADRFDVDDKLDSVLLFNEDSEKALARVSMPEITTPILDSLIASNQYLALPGLSSQEVLEDVCPSQSLGVVLVTTNSPKYNNARAALRQMALESEYSVKQVRFAYIDGVKQEDFLSDIAEGHYEDNPMHLVVWRRNNSQIKYEWIKGINLDFDTAKAKEAINATIQKHLTSSDAFPHEAYVQDLYDEHAPGLLAEWIDYLLHQLTNVLEQIYCELIIAAVSLLMAAAIISGFKYVKVYFLIGWEALKNLIRGTNLEGFIARPHRPVAELYLLELKPLTYNMFVRARYPGIYTIVLISHPDTRAALVRSFHNACWPHRKSSHFLFAHLSTVNGLTWLSQLLCASVGLNEKLTFNPRKCAGTVLAINGSQKYFCLYSNRHAECVRESRRMLRIIGHFINQTDSDFGNLDMANVEYWLNEVQFETAFEYHVDAWPVSLTP